MGRTDKGVIQSLPSRGHVTEAATPWPAMTPYAKAALTFFPTKLVAFIYLAVYRAHMAWHLPPTHLHMPPLFS